MKNAALVSRILARVRKHVLRGEVRFTLKALAELSSLGFGLDEQDAFEILCALTRKQFATRLRSGVTGEWMYVFKPQIMGSSVYLKLVLRDECIVVSFHEDVVANEE